MYFAIKTESEFKDEKMSYEFYQSKRWDCVPICPHRCSEKRYKIKPRGKFLYTPSYRFTNRQCDLPDTVRTASIFESSKAELRKWIHAIYETTTY